MEEEDSVVAHSHHRAHIVPTKDMLLHMCAKDNRGSREPAEKVLGNVTHLQLNDKNLTKISNLKFCTGLRVLYLYDNHIERIENLDFASQLTHLYLQNNELSCIENVSELKKLQKLYLDGNHISDVSGLEECFRLEELTISRQKLPMGMGLTFSHLCMESLAGSLCVLKASDCGIRDDQLVLIASLKYLEDCELRDNEVQRIEYAQHLASECPRLTNLDLRGNPVCKRAKYRSMLVMHGDRLRSLDDKEVTSQEREFILRLQIHKSKLKQKSASAREKETREGIQEDPEGEMMEAATRQLQNQHLQQPPQDDYDMSRISFQPTKKKQLSKVTIGLDD